MRIELQRVLVRDLTQGFKDNAEAGVVAYDGKLDVRPPYQREFIYKDKQRDAVIDTVTKDYPLNVMYWAVRENGEYEVIDGQQRTLSICQFVDGQFAFNERYFHNLETDEQEQVLNYPLMVYLCSGPDSEKLEWFKTINIAGEKLTDQELRNAVYAGSWVADAKRHFSKNGCPAYGLGGDYLTGAPIRQEFLETGIKWISKGSIELYMAKQQNKPNANELWLYFQAVINWTKVTFPNYRKEMKGVAWGELYDAHRAEELDPAKLEQEVVRLMADEDVTNKRGIHPYVLNKDERHLNIRQFTPNHKREAFERQKGVCPACVKAGAKKSTYTLDEMEGDHVTPWHAGGHTAANNCQMLCKRHNREKSGT